MASTHACVTTGTCRNRASMSFSVMVGLSATTTIVASATLRATHRPTAAHCAMTCRRVALGSPEQRTAIGFHVKLGSGRGRGRACGRGQRGAALHDMLTISWHYRRLGRPGTPPRLDPALAHFASRRAWNLTATAVQRWARATQGKAEVVCGPGQRTPKLDLSVQVKGQGAHPGVESARGATEISACSLDTPCGLRVTSHETAGFKSPDQRFIRGTMKRKRSTHPSGPRCTAQLEGRESAQLPHLELHGKSVATCRVLEHFSL